MSILFYQRPDYVKRADGYLNHHDCQRYVERAQCWTRPLPDALQFDRILNNETLPPCTLGDFMDYMIYVAHDAGILQFFLWYRDYCKRFELLQRSEKLLSPPWRNKDADALLNSKHGIIEEPWDDIAKKINEAGNKHTSSMTLPKTFSIPRPHNRHENWPLKPTPEDDWEKDETKYFKESLSSQKYPFSTHKRTSQVASRAGLKWQGFTIQPFRSEITRIMGHYIAPGSPRELPLDFQTRTAVIHALQITTHPSAFDPAIQMIETTLRHQAHPNFIRWSICNCNKPRVFFVRSQGIIHTFLGFFVAVMLILSDASRWWRIFAAPLWFIGTSTLIASYKGLCVVLHSSHESDIKPWEDPAGLYSTFTGSYMRDDNPATPSNSKICVSTQGGLNNGCSDTGTVISTASASELDEMRLNLDTFGSANDSYLSTESWIRRYQCKSLIRKIFDITIKVQDKTLCVLQDKIALQAQAWGLILTVIFAAVFITVPKGNLY